LVVISRLVSGLVGGLVSSSPLALAEWSAAMLGNQSEDCRRRRRGTRVPVGVPVGGDVGDWSEYWLVVMSGTGRVPLVGGDVMRLVGVWSEDWSVQRWALAALAEWSAAILQLVRGLSAATSGTIRVLVGVLVGGDVGDWSEYWLVVMSARLVGDWSVQRWVFEWQDYDRFKSTVQLT
jgi:hypothetical protein